MDTVTSLPDDADWRNQAAHLAGTTLRGELAALKNDLDALIAHQATLSDGEVSEAYARILARLGSSSHAARVAAQERPPSAYRLACARIRERPLAWLAAAAGGGLLAGWLARRG